MSDALEDALNGAVGAGNPTSGDHTGGDVDASRTPVEATTEAVPRVRVTDTGVAIPDTPEQTDDTTVEHEWHAEKVTGLVICGALFLVMLVNLSASLITVLRDRGVPQTGSMLNTLVVATAMCVLLQTRHAITLKSGSPKTHRLQRVSAFLNVAGGVFLVIAAVLDMIGVWARGMLVTVLPFCCVALAFLLAQGVVDTLVEHAGDGKRK